KAMNNTHADTKKSPHDRDCSVSLLNNFACFDACIALPPKGFCLEIANRSEKTTRRVKGLPYPALGNQVPFRPRGGHMGRTWVVVGDGSRARLFRVGPRRDWELIRELEHPQTRAKAKDIVTDRQGRVKQSASPMRSAMQLTKPLHAIEAEHFA